MELSRRYSNRVNQTNTLVKTLEMVRTRLEPGTGPPVRPASDRTSLGHDVDGPGWAGGLLVVRIKAGTERPDDIDGIALLVAAQRGDDAPGLLTIRAGRALDPALRHREARTTTEHEHDDRGAC